MYPLDEDNADYEMQHDLVRDILHYEDEAFQASRTSHGGFFHYPIFENNYRAGWADGYFEALLFRRRDCISQLMNIKVVASGSSSETVTRRRRKLADADWNDIFSLAGIHELVLHPYDCEVVHSWIFCDPHLVREIPQDVLNHHDALGRSLLSSLFEGLEEHLFYNPKKKAFANTSWMGPDGHVRRHPLVTVIMTPHISLQTLVHPLPTCSARDDCHLGHWACDVLGLKRASSGRIDLLLDRIADQAETSFLSLHRITSVLFSSCKRRSVVDPSSFRVQITPLNWIDSLIAGRPRTYHSVRVFEPPSGEALDVLQEIREALVNTIVARGGILE